MRNINHNLFSDERLIALGSPRDLRFIRQMDIVFLRSESCYTKIYLADNSCFMVCRTLKNYEVELDDHLFFRCHKSYMVNLLHINRVIRNNNDQLLLDTGTRVPIARRKVGELKRVMGQSPMTIYR